MTRSAKKIFSALAAVAMLLLPACDGPNLCAQSAQQAGFPKSSMVTAVAVAMAESSCDPHATGQNAPGGACPHGSKDRGLWQINDCYHPQVTDACAYDPLCNAKAALSISSGGTDWTPWTTYKSGAYKMWLDEAQAAVDAL